MDWLPSILSAVLTCSCDGCLLLVCMKFGWFLCIFHRMILLLVVLCFFVCRRQLRVFQLLFWLFCVCEHRYGVCYSCWCVRDNPGSLRCWLWNTWGQWVCTWLWCTPVRLYSMVSDLSLLLVCDLGIRFIQQRSMWLIYPVYSLQ